MDVVLSRFFLQEIYFMICRYCNYKFVALCFGLQSEEISFALSSTLNKAYSEPNYIKLNVFFFFAQLSNTRLIINGDDFIFVMQLTRKVQ